MNESLHDAGVIAVLMERFEKQRLPRAQSLKEKVDRGELLDEYDLAFLEEVFADSNKIKPLVDRHPEYQELVSRAVRLYKEITDKAMENEKSG
ncbi:MAG: hypothetical protein WAL92_05550 [Thiogranum sp.]